MIAWIESMRAEMRRENELFREQMMRENEVWKAGVKRELREEIRQIVVEKFLADHKPSSSETSSLNVPEEQSPLFPPGLSTVHFGESLHVHGGSSTAAGKQPATTAESTQAGPPIPSRRGTKPPPSPTTFVLPRKPRIGSYYAAIIDTDGDDKDGILLAHMIEIATHRPGFLFSHTGTPWPHRDCCAILYFATMTNVHDWMRDVNEAYRLDKEEIERLERNSGDLKRKRRFDAFVRICKVEAEDPWEIFEKTGKI
jgi:hypothetical protein